MGDEKRMFKWWVSWEPEKIEKWLEEMETKGWRLKKADWNAIRFQFQRGEPRQIRYCVDYQDKKDEDYIQLFKEIGWQLIYSGAGWYIWRMPFTEQRPEIYSDFDSLISRNKRVLSLLYIVLIAQLPILFVNLFVNKLHNPVVLTTVCLHLFVICLLPYGISRIVTTNRRLSEKRDNIK